VRQLGLSPLTAFYTARDVALATKFTGLPYVNLADAKLPMRLELILDDNYAVRMLCGGPVHEQVLSLHVEYAEREKRIRHSIHV